MKLKVLQENLSRALTTSSRLTATRVQLPVLANVLLKTQKNKLLVCSTNLELSISIPVGARVEEEGEITIPARVLTEIVSNLKSGQIDLETDKESLKISALGFESKISGMNASDFPLVSQELGAKVLNIPSKNFLEALDQTLFSVSQDEARPVLTGVLVIIKKEELVLVATDGFRLSQKRIKMQGSSEERSFILPKTALIEISRLATEDTSIGLSFKKAENQAIFAVEESILATRIIEGDFPDFERIIPRDTKIKIFLDKEEFLRAVKLASVFARDSANVVKLEVGEGVVSVLSESSQLGTQKTQVEAKIEGNLTFVEKFLVAFNYRFLEEFLGVVESSEVQIEFTDSNSPALFLDTKDTQFLHIIMPVRLTS